MRNPAPSNPTVFSYCELNALSNFSFLQGASHPRELIKQAAKLKLKALAITDRNSLAGVVRAHVAAKQCAKTHPIKLIIGARLVLTEGLEISCLPKNMQAYGALSTLLTKGQRRANKGECELTLQDLAGLHKDLILIALPSQNFPIDEMKQTQFTNHLTQLKRLTSDCPLYISATVYRDGSDKRRLFLLSKLAKELRLPLVATGDVLYHSKKRKPLQDILTAIYHGKNLDEAGTLLEKNTERALKSPRTMIHDFQEYPDALETSCQIADQITFSLDELSYDYPKELMEKGQTPQGLLEKETWKQAKNRYPDGIPDDVSNSLNNELALIKKLKYAPYFLTVYDLVSFARRQNIFCQGRGSAANSTVCYCLGITNVNPTQVDLLFERFMSQERNEPPDIDVDFEHDRREEVIQYIYEHYGRERAAIAATVITYRARSAFRDVGKAMGLCEDLIGRLSKTVWGSGKTTTSNHLSDAGINLDDPHMKLVLRFAKELVGFPRHLSQHVGGFVLSHSPLHELVPIGNSAMDGRTFIEWDKDDLSALGMMKVDVLALGMLSCLHKACDLLREHNGLDHTLATIPREDPKVYDMLCKADSLGVFQVESRAQMSMLPRLKPRNFYDLVIEVALVRPGPIQGNMVHPYLRRRDGLEKETYPAPHPDHGKKDELVDVLKKTKGVPLFQEQAMKLAMVAAKFTGDEANQLRSAMATFRRRGTIGTLEQKFVSRMTSRGYDPDFAQSCFNQIKGFGDYGFPESHAASFAHLVYISAWFKCLYPAHFACALLNSYPMGFYAPAQIIIDAKKHEVEVRPIDINFSSYNHTLELGGQHPALRLGFRLIDGLSSHAVDQLIEARTKQQRLLHAKGKNIAIQALPFTSLYGFWVQTKLSQANLEKLAHGDCFQSLGLNRREALWDLSKRKNNDALPLFAWGKSDETGGDAPFDLPTLPLSQDVLDDFATTGLSLKKHPMHFIRSYLAPLKPRPCAELASMQNGQSVLLSGIILVRQRPGTGKGVVFITLEDETMHANLIIWPKIFEAHRSIIMQARILTVWGRVQKAGEVIHVVVTKLRDDTTYLNLMRETVQKQLTQADKADALSKSHPIEPSSPSHPRNKKLLPKSRDFH